MTYTFGQVVNLDSPTGHQHPHIEVLDAALEVVGYAPVQAGIDASGAPFVASTSELQTQLLAELKLANAPTGYKKNAAGEVINVLRLVDGVVQSYPLVKTTDGTDTVYTPGAWA
jgi:hypothetical protein